MPVLLARRYPDDVAGPDFPDGSALGLHAADARDHVQRLPKRMRVPGGPRAGLEELRELHTSRAGAAVAMIGSCSTVPVK